MRTGGTGELLKWAKEGDEPVCDVFWGGSLYTAGAEKTYLSLISVKMKNMSGRNLKTKREI